MDNLNELKAIWKTAKTDTLPIPGEMLRLVKRYRNKKLRNKLRLIAGCFLLIIFFVSAWFYNRPHFISTSIGMLMTTGAVIILAITNIRSIGRFIKLNDCSNKEFISFLEQTRRNQLFYHQKTQVFGILLASAGFLLYIFEFVYQSILLSVIFYTSGIAYIAFVWFYLRVVKYKKQTAELNNIIEKLERMSYQIL